MELPDLHHHAKKCGSPSTAQVSKDKWTPIALHRFMDTTKCHDISKWILSLAHPPTTKLCPCKEKTWIMLAMSRY